jgi:hypothetical protein
LESKWILDEMGEPVQFLQIYSGSVVSDESDPLLGSVELCMRRRVVFEEKNKTDQIWVSQKTINDAYVKFGAFAVNIHNRPDTTSGFSCYISLIDDAHPDTTFFIILTSINPLIGLVASILPSRFPRKVKYMVMRQVCVIRLIKDQLDT